MKEYTILLPFRQQYAALFASEAMRSLFGPRDYMQVPIYS